MKKVFLMIAATLLFASCNKNDEVVKSEQDPIPSSIITLKWVLSSIRCVKINTPQINISTNDYILVFTSDTSFKFNTSVNEAGGSYKRINDQTIYISSYQEKATDNPATKQIDKLLLEEFRDSMTVECDKNKLVLYNQTSEFVFYLPDWDI